MANRIMGRSFTLREKILLLVMGLLAIGALYYFGVVKTVADAQASSSARLDEIEIRTAAQKTLAANYADMKQKLDALGSIENLPMIAPYDNMKNELTELNTVLGTTLNHTVNFDTPTRSDNTVRRTVRITYSTTDYNSALDIIESLQNGTYRCQVDDISVIGKLLGDGTPESVTTTLILTYYETTTGAASTDGLEEKGK